MKTLAFPRAAALALSGAALMFAGSAAAQTVVVPAQNQAPPPPSSNVVVNQPAPAAPAQTNMQAPAPSGPVVVNNGGGPVADAPGPTYTRPNRALLMTGLVAFGVPYIASVSVAATSSHAGDSNLWVPAIGPWLDLGARGGCPASSATMNPDCGAETGNKVVLVADGILQTFGVLEVIGAFVFPETCGPAAVVTGENGENVSFTPAKLGNGGYGLAALGRF
ncbi:MAG: hypothetical protein JOZ69_08980 [Myxococcales bacterium]|nr:hypothetical protein [Myxococcales bacterium]